MHHLKKLEGPMHSHLVTNCALEPDVIKMEAVMIQYKFRRVALFLSCVLALGTFSAIAIGNEAANYKLFESIQALNVDGVRESLSRGADPNARDPKGKAHFKAFNVLMLYFAGQKNEDVKDTVFKIAKLLIDHGAKVGPSENDILFIPIAEGHIPLIKLLLDNGASPFKNFEGKSPMEWAVYYQQDKVVNLLKNYGVQKITARDEAQINLIKAAADHDLKGIIDALKSGARLNDKDSSGHTPLIEAIRDPIYKEE